MRSLWGICLLSVVLAGCNMSASTPAATPHGRYVGIGAYSAGALWSKMAVSGPAKPTAATTADDEHVIVVVDSQTGEVRECGDYSGVCVGLNPWTRAIATSQASPVTLTRHLAEVARESQAANTTSAP